MPLGMDLNQLINMLVAAREQGAKFASIAIARPETGAHESAGVDWVSTAPVDGVVYILPMPQREVLSNAAAESVDL